MSDPALDPALSDASSALSIPLENCENAAQLTKETLEHGKQIAQDKLDELSVSNESRKTFDLVAYGSIARYEMGPSSDFDWLVVANGYSTDPHDFPKYKAAAEKVRQDIGAEEPGASGLFGTVTGATEFVNTIGLDEDTNARQTRRVLTLEESISLLKPDQHRQLRKAITSRYLHDQVDEVKVPRFLLNDVVRYWRTVAVDYQAKRWQEAHKKLEEEEENRKTTWALRLLKLRTTRKLTYAGTLAALFAPPMRNEHPSVDHLLEEWERPPLARLAAWHNLVTGDALNALADVLKLADWFVYALSQNELRDEARKVGHPREAEEGSLLRQAYEKTRDLHTALNDLFLSSDTVVENPELTVRELTKSYLLF